MHNIKYIFITYVSSNFDLSKKLKHNELQNLCRITFCHTFYSAIFLIILHINLKK